MISQIQAYNYPFLSTEEFNLACHFLDQKYIAASLGVERRKFQLCLQHTLVSDLVFISITKPVDVSCHDVDLELEFNSLRWEEEGDVMNLDVAIEEADSAVVRRASVSGDHEPPKYTVQSQQPYVVYELHLHPTYQTPVLWFSLHDLPPLDSPFDIEIVYRYLVPDQYKSHLRSVGVIGGISAANHPVTDVPAFFIHPCATKEAMEEFQCTLKDYLAIWLGLVGGFVGLWLPKAMAQVSMKAHVKP